MAYSNWGLGRISLRLACGVTELSLKSRYAECCSTLYPMPKPMGLELKVKEKNTTVLKHRLSGAGQDLGRISLASGRRARAGG